MNRTELLAVAKPILFNQEMVGAILVNMERATKYLMHGNISIVVINLLF